MKPSDAIARFIWASLAALVFSALTWAVWAAWQEGTGIGIVVSVAYCYVMLTFAGATLAAFDK